MNDGKALIVDDEADILELVRITLAKQGYESVMRADPNKAMDLLLRDPFALLVTDINMPLMGGFELAAAAKLRDIPCIVISGAYEKNLDQKLEQNNCIDTFTSPSMLPSS
ncbi:MAG: response regulator [Planctomycetes bacterium]|nr:response regulator [Planctomycetota bacterium]